MINRETVQMINRLKAGLHLKQVVLVLCVLFFLPHGTSAVGIEVVAGHSFDAYDVKLWDVDMVLESYACPQFRIEGTGSVSPFFSAITKWYTAAKCTCRVCRSGVFLEWCKDYHINRFGRDRLRRPVGRAAVMFIKPCTKDTLELPDRNSQFEIRFVRPLYAPDFQGDSHLQ